MYIYTDSGVKYESRVTAQEQQRQRRERHFLQGNPSWMRGKHMPDLGKVEITHLMQRKLWFRVEVVGV